MNSIRNADLKDNTRVLVRADLDVPLVEGEIQDTYRLDHLLPTLNFIKSKGSEIVLMGHMGRPNGAYSEELSTNHLKPYFDKVLGSGRYKLLENLRFDIGERENSMVYAKKLVLDTGADIYVNESFANSHRNHASMVSVPKIVPSYCGFRLEEEVNILKGILSNPERPLVFIIGGAKVETKRPVISKFLKISDSVLVGGKIGIDWDLDKPDNLYLPYDYKEDQKDIGEKTINKFLKLIKSAGTVVWSGPLGKFEEFEFSDGTSSVVKGVVTSSAFSVIGGGDTISAFKKFDFLENVDFVSSGGGSMLEFLEKGTLPALEVLAS